MAGSTTSTTPVCRLLTRPNFTRHSDKLGPHILTDIIIAIVFVWKAPDIYQVYSILFQQQKFGYHEDTGGNRFTCMTYNLLHVLYIKTLTFSYTTQNNCANATITDSLFLSMYFSLFSPTLLQRLFQHTDRNLCETYFQCKRSKCWYWYDGCHEESTNITQGCQ